MEDFNFRPGFFKYTQTYSLWGTPLTFYLDTDKQGRVSAFHFEFNGDPDFLSVLQKAGIDLLGAPLGEFSLVQEKTSFPFLNLLLRKFSYEIRDSQIPFSSQKGRNPESLLCRCFGVYEEDIHELIGTGAEITSLRDLGDHLNAGIGCGSCHQDLLSVLNPLISSPIESVSPIAELPLWQKLDSQSLANEIFSHFKKINSENAGNFELKIKGTRPGGVLIGCRLFGKDDKEAIKKHIEQEIEKAFGPGLECIMTFSS